VEINIWTDCRYSHPFPFGQHISAESADLHKD